MKRYSEYKDSGVKWIGEIPGHWNAVSLKRVVKLINEKSNEQNIPYIALENIESFTGKILSLNEIEPDSICNKFKKDDVLFCKLRPYLTKCVSPSFDGKCTSELLVLRNFNGVANYLKYTLLSPRLVMDINASTYGAKMPRANWNYIGLCRVPLPPLPEQEAIVTYLDTKVAKIDEYISIAEKKIAALEELKQTIITEAVTRGIHKDVPMKDSGVKWIGMIPEHWKMKSLRSYVKLYSEKNHPEKQLLSVTREMGVIVRNTESKEENHNFIPDELSGYKLVRKGDFVINKMKSWQGSYGVSKYEGIVSPAYYVCKLEFPYNDFFSIAIRCKSYVPFFTQYSKGIRVDQWDLSPIALKNIPFMEPPIAEQQEIVTYIEAKVANINQLCQAERSQIEKLKEYKQRLISDVVTGKVKVTND